MPRPTRTLRCRDPRGGFKFDRFTAMWPSTFWRATSVARTRLLFHSHQMANLENHSANGRRVVPLDDLIQAAESESANRLPQVLRAGDEAFHPFDFQNAR